MSHSGISSAVRLLAQRYPRLHWQSRSGPEGHPVYLWPGPAGEEITLSLYRGQGVTEPFHRHDFFYINYTYQGRYESVCPFTGKRLAVGPGDIYAGQPFAGHSLVFPSEPECRMVGVLIRPETVFQTFLPLLSSAPGLLSFLTSPADDHTSAEAIHFHAGRDSAAAELIRLMVLEYVRQAPDSQDILKPLALALLMELSRRYRESRRPAQPGFQALLEEMDAHMDTVTLTGLARQFSYHPNYLSSLFRRQTGQTFSQLLLSRRMERSAALLRTTALPVEQIAALVGYKNSSNFYKAFRAYYHRSPREFAPQASGPA